MDWRLINRAFGSIVSVHWVVAIGSSSASLGQVTSDAHENLVDATYRRQIQALITDSGHAILSTIQIEAVPSRFADGHALN